MVDTRYRKNAGAVFTLKYHLVFCPKYRKPILGGPVAERLKELLYKKAAELDAKIYAQMDDEMCAHRPEIGHRP